MLPQESNINVDAELDVVICSYLQPELTNLVVENYRLLESETKLRFWIIEGSGNFKAFRKIVDDREDVTKVFINSTVFDKHFGSNKALHKSAGLSLAVQIGLALGRSKLCFVSHTDMMGYSRNFLSQLRSHLSTQLPMASFCTRGVLPFSAGTMYDRDFFSHTNFDWLPMKVGDFPREITNRSGVSDYLVSSGAQKVIDAGEKWPLYALAKGKQIFALNSRGHKSSE